MASSPTSGAMPPPPGVTPNFDNPDRSLQATWLAGLLVCLIVPTILVALRLYVKVYVIKNTTVTDYICFLAWVGDVVLVAIALTEMNYGVDIHAWNLRLETFTMWIKIINIHQIVYMPSILLTKTAVLLQLLEIFVTQKRSYRWYSLMGLIGANVIFFAILFFIEVFQCIPREKIWNPTVPGHCIEIQKTYVATGVINVCDDFLILILPLYWVWLLQVSSKRKVGISLIFAAGLFACITSILRLYESIINIGSLDVTYSLAPVSLWAVAEVASGISVCCLPTLPRLFVRRQSQRGSAPTYATTDSSTIKSKKQYIEMDDLAFPQPPSTSADVESQRAPNYQDFHLSTAPRNTQPPRIVKTVTINQSSANGT